MFAGVVRPKSRWYLRLTGSNPLDPIEIHANMLSHPDDVKAAVAAVELCREVGNSATLRPFVKREAMPGIASPFLVRQYAVDAGRNQRDHQT